MSGALKHFLEAGGVEIEMSGDGVGLEPLIEAASKTNATPTIVQSCANGGAAMTTIIRGPS